MKDIAEELGVSIVTVSKALSGKDGVGEELRQSIQKEADKMGYVSKSNQKKFELGNPNIGIVVAERYIADNNAFYFKVYQKMIMELSSRELVGILEIVRQEDENKGNIPNVIQMNTVEQVIVIGEMKTAYLEKLNKTDVSLVFFDFENEDFDVDSIIGDNVGGGYTMTRYLAKKGYTNIGYVGNYKATRSILDRFVGNIKYKLAKGLPLAKDSIIFDRDENGNNIELKLPKKMPEAFFCNCDETAYRLIEVLEEQGYKVPEDIAVVGFDDYAAHIPEGVNLTTYRVDVDEMIHQAVHIVVQRGMNPLYRRGIMLVHGELVERDSALK